VDRPVPVAERPPAAQALSLAGRNGIRR
jgi:hypothetical protein